MRPSQTADLLDVYSNQNREEYSHSFSNEVNGKTCTVKLELDEPSENGVSQNISYKVFGSSESRKDKFWKVYLTDNVPYSLDLDYGLGNANIDLSGLSIEKLKVNTGSADVNLSRARVVVAEVGFGNMAMDFSDTPVVSNHIKGSVGAGNMIIILPGDDTPVMIKINDSWLCGVTPTKGLKKICSNTFANDAWGRDQKNALTFDLEVSMGKIIFKEKSK